MATKPDVTRRLSPTQERAAELLVSGKTITETAKEVGVSRQTVSSWLNHDPVFIAELNYRRDETWNAVKQRLTQLAVSAVDVLEEALRSSDARVRLSAAIHVLKALKLYGDRYEPSGPTTPDGVEAERRWHETLSKLWGGTLDDLMPPKAT